jgi:hypothetical protein
MNAMSFLKTLHFTNFERGVAMCEN